MKKSSRYVGLIAEAASNRKRVAIVYVNRAGKEIKRSIAAYEIKNGYVWATDSKHGPDHIHSFKVDKIKEARALTTKFKPEWEVQL